MDFDFQRYIQERKNSGASSGGASVGASGVEGPAGLRYAYEADRRLLRGLTHSKPVEMALGAVANMDEARLGEIQGDAEAFDDKTREMLVSLVEDACSRLGLTVKPAVRAAGAKGLEEMARMVETAEGPVLFLSQVLVDEASPKALAFVVGRQLGFLQQDQVAQMNALLELKDSKGGAISWIARPAQSALERWAVAGRITADRAGLLACGELRAAAATLIRTAQGWSAGEPENLESVLEEGWEEHPPADGALAALDREKAGLAARVGSLQAFSEAEVYREAYGLHGGDVLSTVDRRVKGLINKG